MKKKPIDRVTIVNLDLLLRLVTGKSFDKKLLDIIIDCVEMIEDKGDKTSLKDAAKIIAWYST